MRTYIAASLIACAGLLFVLVVAAILWALLAALGDQQAVVGVRGVFLVVGVCWIMNLVLLVVLTAVAQLQQLADIGREIEEERFTHRGPSSLDS